MSQLKNYIGLYSDIDRLAADGDLETALRESGMALARSDSEWAEAFNSRSDTADAIESFSLMASQHCELLMEAEMAADAYSTAVIAMFQIATDGNVSDRLDRCLLILHVTALMALSRLVEAIPAPDDNDRDHVGRIMHYLASMLYLYYRRVNTSSPDFDALRAAYRILQDVSGSIAEKLDVTGQDNPVDPASPLPMLGDLIGRSRAMGWLH